jgi:hypothetical protein
VPFSRKAVHAEAQSAAVTDCRQIVALYNRLVQIQPSPVVQLNRAVAIAMRDGPEVGLTHIDAVLEHGELANYYLAHSARADMYAGSPKRLLEPCPPTCLPPEAGMPIALLEVRPDGRNTCNNRLSKVPGASGALSAVHCDERVWNVFVQSIQT